MAEVWECTCNIARKTLLLTPDGKNPWTENCPDCKRKFRKVGTTPRKVPTDTILPLAVVQVK